MKTLGLCSVLLAATLPVLAVESQPTTSESYAFATYLERSGRLVALVDSYPAFVHVNDRYIPLSIAVGVLGNGKSVVLAPESFTLVDSSGNSYSTVPYTELLQNYPQRDFDATLVRQRPIVVGTIFSTSVRLPARFYPAPATLHTRVDRVELPPFTWMNTLIYFPRPQPSLGGVLTLRISTGGAEPPIEVRFRVPKQD